MEILNFSKENEGSNYVNKRSFDIRKILILIILLNIFSLKFAVSREVKSHLVQEEEFPELSEEELTRAKQYYATEDDIDQKGYLEPIVKPESFDLNKDKRISKEELKKAIKYCIFPKENSKKKILSEEFKNHVNNQVDLYVEVQNLDTLNYKQFGKFMNRINAQDFINMETMSNVHMSPKEYRETSNDL